MPKKHRKRSTKRYENIVFEGGGVHGIGYIGCINRLEKLKLRKGITRIGGASIGALMGFAMACGVPAETIYDDAKSITKEHMTGGISTFRAIHNLCWYWGMYDMQASIGPFLSGLFERYCGCVDITFSQLHEKFGADLHLVVYNGTRGRGEVMSMHTVPDMPVYPVVVAAMSFPGYFMPVVLPGSTDLYIDGGTVNNFPLYIFDAEEHGGDGHYNPKTLGIRSVSDQSVYFGEAIGFNPPAPTGLVDYFEGVIASMVESGQQRYEQPRDAERTFFMQLPKAISSMDFNVSEDEKKQMYDIGYDGLGKFIR